MVNLLDPCRLVKVWMWRSVAGSHRQQGAAEGGSRHPPRSPLKAHVHVKLFQVWIDSELFCRDPWVLPVEATARRAATASKARLAEGAGGASDHLALVTAFNGWVAARQAGGGRDRAFCAEHFLSSATMQMVEGMRHQLLGELKVGWRIIRVQSGLAPASCSWWTTVANSCWDGMSATSTSHSATPCRGWVREAPTAWKAVE